MRPQIALEDVKEQIELWLQAGHSIKAIVNLLANEEVRVSESSLGRRLHAWGLKQKNQSIYEIDGLEDTLSELVYVRLFKDREILALLESIYATTVSIRSLRRARKRFGIDRHALAAERHRKMAEWRLIIDNEIKRGTIGNYGRRFLHAYFKQNTGVRLNQQDLYTIIKELDPEGVQRRSERGFVKKKSAFITPGPDFIWAVDGHMKLEPFGIEIYGCIDVYSRKMIWVYVGTTARTAWSVYCQYIEALRTYKCRPYIVRSDKGTETTFMANLHWSLVKRDYPDIAFAKCFFYGKSTSNTRIESWWQQLTRTHINRFREHFKNLEELGLYDRTRIPDQIALLATYIPILREVLMRFVMLWDNHRIESNKHHPWVVTGMPEFIYNCPGAVKGSFGTGMRYGRPIDLDLLAQLEQEVEQGPDIHAYLPTNVLELCDEIWTAEGLNKEDLSDGSYDNDRNKLHTQFYMVLRDSLYLREERGDLPVPGLLPQPTIMSETVPRCVLDRFGHIPHDAEIQELDNGLGGMPAGEVARANIDAAMEDGDE